MDSSVQALGAILGELKLIRWLLIALLLIGCYFVVLFLGSTRAVIKLGEVIDKQGAEKTLQIELEDLLARGLANSAKSKASQWATRAPNEPYAHWILGKAHYQLGELVQAKGAFETLMTISPDWGVAAKSWLERVNADIQSSGPKVVK